MRLAPGMPEKLHNAEKACNTKDFEYPYGQIPCIAGFLDMNNKSIDRSIVSMLRSMFGGDEAQVTIAIIMLRKEIYNFEHQMD